MTDNPIDYSRLLVDHFQQNPFWMDLASSMNDLFNPMVQNPAEMLAKMRDVNVESYYAGLNMQMLGFRVPVLSFNPQEYVRLMGDIGKYVQTRGASIKFVDFIGYIKATRLTYIPLWANDINDIDSLSDTPGTPIWQGGEWFPTPFYRVAYDASQLNVTDEAEVSFLFTVLAPIHLVLAALTGVDRFATTEYISPYAFNIQHDFAYAASNMPSVSSNAAVPSSSGPFISVNGNMGLSHSIQKAL
jgi:hypothetical protein